jgi:hypothetical protein
VPLTLCVLEEKSIDEAAWVETRQTAVWQILPIGTRQRLTDLDYISTHGNWVNYNAPVSGPDSNRLFA